MKAVYLKQHGNSENLIFTENFEKPIPKENEVLVRIQYTTINRIDLTLRKGYEFGKESPFSFPKILGSDAVGEIESFGNISLKNDLNIGEKVLVLPYFYTNNMKFSLGINYQGTYAEYISVPIISLIKINSDLDLINFSALPTAGLIAFKCFKYSLIGNSNLISHYNLEDSNLNILILGGSGGVGSFAIQIAKILNLVVTTSAGNNKNISKLKEMCADEVLNHYDDNFKEILMSKYQNHIDLIIDFLGGDFIDLYLDLAKSDAEIISIGGFTGKNSNINLQKLYSKNIKINGKSIYENIYNYSKSIEIINRMIKYIENNKIVNSINNIYSLEEIPKVHQIMENGVYFGKSIIKIY